MNVHVLNIMSRNSADNARIAHRRALRNDVADVDVPDRARLRISRPAQPAPQPNVQRRARHLPHHDVRNRHVVDHPSIHAFDRQALAIVEQTVRDRDVLESPVRFRPELDASRPRDVPIFPIWPDAVARPDLLERPIQQRSLLIPSADQAIRDRHVFRIPNVTQPVRTFEHDRIVVRRIHAAIRNRHVPAAVDVHPVTIRVDLHVVDGQSVHRRRQDSEMPPFINREIPQNDVVGMSSARSPCRRSRWPALPSRRDIPAGWSVG